MSNRNNLFFLAQAWRKTFLITLVFVTFSSGLFWLDAFRSYEAETRLLVVGKSRVADADQVASSLASLSGNLSFYDRVLSAYDTMDDPFESFSPDKRKSAWNREVSVAQDGGSGVIVIRANGDDPEDARVLARLTSKTISEVASLYYDVKTDVDIRIVEGPITKTVIMNPIVYAMTSLFSAIILTSAFFFLLAALPAVFSMGKREETIVPECEPGDGVLPYGVGDAVPYIDPRKFIPERPSALAFETMHQETKIPASFVRSGAPSNLPVASEDMDLPVAGENLPFSFEEEEAVPEYSTPETSFRGEHEVDTEAAPSIIMGGEEFHAYEAKQRGEPTVEEYKRRLNELLQGGK